MSEFELSAGVYSPNSLSIVGGEGAIIVDSAGKKYLDCVGGHGVASVGHANLKVAEAVKNAWGKSSLEHCKVKELTLYNF